MDRHLGPHLKGDMQRRILGISAIVLLLGAAATWLWFPGAEIVLSGCWRGGAVFAAAWLAYPDVQRLPNWLLLTFPVLLIVMLRWPWLLMLAILLLVVVAVLRNLRAGTPTAQR
jgi:hypothetical protein